MKPALGRNLAIKALEAYKVAVSPWLPPACRFTPTCSDYAREAFEHYGLIRALSKAVGRLLRCHPLHRGGFDPLI